MKVPLCCEELREAFRGLQNTGQFVRQKWSTNTFEALPQTRRRRTSEQRIHHRPTCARLLLSGSPPRRQTSRNGCLDFSAFRHSNPHRSRSLDPSPITDVTTVIRTVGWRSSSIPPSDPLGAEI